MLVSVLPHINVLLTGVATFQCPVENWINLAVISHLPSHSDRLARLCGALWWPLGPKQLLSYALHLRPGAHLAPDLLSVCALHSDFFLRCAAPAPLSYIPAVTLRSSRPPRWPLHFSLRHLHHPPLDQRRPWAGPHHPLRHRGQALWWAPKSVASSGSLVWLLD